MAPVLQDEVELLSIVRESAAFYIQGNPGSDTQGGNTPYHQDIRDIVSGKPVDHSVLRRLHPVLVYRLELISLFNNYREFLDLQISPCEMINVEQWIGREVSLPSANNPDSRWKKYGEIREQLFKSLIEEPRPEQGLYYTKPIAYLAIALVESGWDMQKILEGIQKLKNCKFF